MQGKVPTLPQGGRGAYTIDLYFQNHGSGTTTLSQLGRHSGGAKPRERQCFPIIGRCTFPPVIAGMQFSLIFLSLIPPDGGAGIVRDPKCNCGKCRTTPVFQICI